MPEPVASHTTGKSSLAVRYVDCHFVESYYPTIENTFSKEIRFKGQDFSTEIVDTAGQVRETTRVKCRQTPKLTDALYSSGLVVWATRMNTAS